MQLSELTVRGFADLLGSDAPAPGGGSAAALAGALGAALTAMVGSLTVGKKKYAEFDGLARETLEKARDLEHRFLDVMQRDTEAFNAVSAVFAMPKGTDEEKTAVLETAKADALATAQAIQSRLTNGEDAQALADEYADALYSSSIHTTAMGSTFSSAAYADWLYDAARQSGDITLAELDRSESSAYNYYVVQFDSRTRDDSATADVRHILIGAASSGTTPTQEEFDAAEAEAQALLDQWKAGGATEDSFAALAVQNTDDSGSQSTGGLYSGISSTDSLEPNFLNWALDPARQPGDTGIVKNESSSIQGWHIMYFVGWDDPAWEYTVKSTWKESDTSEWLASLTENVEAVHGSGLDLVS